MIATSRSSLKARRSLICRTEGPACRVRCVWFDDPFRLGGRDKHAPPDLPSEGLACRVRLSEGPACRVR